MSHAQRVFEAIMRVKGHTEFEMANGRYVNPSLQVRWNYFCLGWEMHEVTTPPVPEKGSA